MSGRHLYYCAHCFAVLPGRLNSSHTGLVSVLRECWDLCLLEVVALVHPSAWNLYLVPFHHLVLSYSVCTLMGLPLSKVVPNCHYFWGHHSTIWILYEIIKFFSHKKKNLSSSWWWEHKLRDSSNAVIFTIIFHLWHLVQCLEQSKFWYIFIEWRSKCFYECNMSPLS